MIPPRPSDAGPEDRRNYQLLYLRGDLERLPEATDEPLEPPDDATDPQVPDEPLCPILEALIMKAQNVVEVCQLFDQHETECDEALLLAWPALRRCGYRDDSREIVAIEKALAKARGESPNA